MSYYQHPLDATGLPSWKALKEHRLTMQNFSMREAFKADPTRFDDLSVSCSGLFLDYSKNLITPETRTLLVNLAREAGVEQAARAMFEGERINASENRPVLHTALRRPMGESVMVDGKNIMRDVHAALAQMTDIVTRIHNNLWRGFSDKTITDVVNIGIGGSFLGPQLVSEALLPFTQHGVRRGESATLIEDIHGRTDFPHVLGYRRRFAYLRRYRRAPAWRCPSAGGADGAVRDMASGRARDRLGARSGRADRQPGLVAGAGHLRHAVRDDLGAGARPASPDHRRLARSPERGSTQQCPGPGDRTAGVGCRYGAAHGRQRDGRASGRGARAADDGAVRHHRCR